MFLNKNFFELLDFLDDDLLIEKNLEPYLRAVYDAFCRQNQQQKVAKLVIKNFENGGLTKEHWLTHGYCRGDTIFINKSFLPLMLSSNNQEKYIIITTLIHENRHFLQKMTEPNQSTKIDYAEASSNVFYSFMDFKQSLSNLFRYISNVRPEFFSKYDELCKEQLQEIDELEFFANASSPWEIDARNYTLEQLKNGLDTKPYIEQIFLSEQNLTKLIESKSKEFSMLELFEAADNFLKNHPREMSLFENAKECYDENKKIVMDIYKKHGVQNKEQEKEFLKNLYPENFAASNVPAQKNMHPSL